MVLISGSQVNGKRPLWSRGQVEWVAKMEARSGVCEEEVVVTSYSTRGVDAVGSTAEAQVTEMKDMNKIKEI